MEAWRHAGCIHVRGLQRTGSWSLSTAPFEARQQLLMRGDEGQEGVGIKKEQEAVEWK